MKCKVERCHNPARQQGYCGYHYAYYVRSQIARPQMAHVQPRDTRPVWLRRAQEHGFVPKDFTES